MLDQVSFQCIQTQIPPCRRMGRDFRLTNGGGNFVTKMLAIESQAFRRSAIIPYS